jgi:hypothetical protein
MGFRQILLKLSLIFSETCFFVLLYFCLAGSFQGSYLANPAVFLILTGVLTVFNSIVSGHNLRRLTIGLINLLLTVLIVAGMTWRSGPVFFVIPAETLPAFNVVLFDFLFIWLGFRSIHLAYKKPIPDLYSHFDWFIILTFLVLLTMGLTKIAPPGGLLWVIAAFIFNLLPLFMVNQADSKDFSLSVGTFVLFIIVLLSGATKTVPLFHYVSGTAGNIFDGLKHMFMAVIPFITGILLFGVRLIMFLNRKNINSTVKETPAQSDLDVQTLVNSGIPSWVNTILRVIPLLIMTIFLIIVASYLCQLLRYLIGYLLKRQNGKEPLKFNFNPFTLWKEFCLWIIKFLQKAGYFILLFLPAADISIERAYRQLLWWGSWKRHPRQIYETPHIYCKRLSGYYNDLSAELSEITNAYVVYRYSGKIKANTPNVALKHLLRKIYLIGWYRLGNFCLNRLNFDNRRKKKIETVV